MHTLIFYLFLHGYGLHYNTRSNWGYTLVYYPGGRPVSMQNFRFIVRIVYLFLHGCGLHYNVLSGLSVKQELKALTTNNYIHVTMHYPG